MPSREEFLLEADRRGLLPAKQSAMLKEAQKRGLLAEKPQPELPENWQRDMAISATRGEHPILAGTMDFLGGMSGLSRGALNLLPGDLGDKVFPKDYTSKDSAAAIAGSMADPIAWGVGLEAGKVLPYTKVLGSGIVNAVKATATNIAGGAVPGAIIGGLSEDQDVTSGAAFGAAANVVLPPAIGAVASGIKKAWTTLDVTSRASLLLKKILGVDAKAVQAATASAPSGLTAAQAASGIGSDTFDALDQLARHHDVEGYFSKLDATQRQDLVDDLVKLAGGANQTEARKVADASKQALGNVTNSMRDEALSQANIAGTIGPELDRKALRLGEAAAAKVDDVRRLSGLQQRATDLGNEGGMTLSNAAPATSLPRLPGRYSYPHELAARAEGAAQSAADASLILGAGARDAKMRAASLAANGLNPLNIGRLTTKMERIIADPKVGADKINRRVLKSVLDQITDEASKNGGVIDAEALYTIRKTAINNEVDRLLGSADPKSKMKRTAALLMRVKPLIDDSIVAAGGTGWRAYLNTYEEGAKQISRQRMGAKALDLLQKNPGKLESLAAGNEPKIVKDIFKTEYDLGVAMGAKMNQPIQRAAAELGRDRRIAEGAKRGSIALGGILQGESARFRLPNWVNAKVAITNRGLEEIESRVNKKTMEAIYRAMRSGKDANTLLSVVPIEERSVVIKALVKTQNSPKLRALMSGIQAGQEQTTEEN